MKLEIFDRAIPYHILPPSNLELKKLLNYNPQHNAYTASQQERDNLGRNPNETDRGGWRGYDRVYTKFLVELKNDPIKLLEIGIEHGYGLLAWNRFFANGTVVGVDNVIDPARSSSFEKITSDFPSYVKVEKIIFDSTNPFSWKMFSENSFDVIIDDGGHHPDTQIDTFKNAWNYLKPGGLYFIEDISHRYSDKKLKKLNDMLMNVEKTNKIEVFSHINNGLLTMLTDPDLRKKYRISSQAPDNPEEYIAVIRKGI